MAELNQMHSGVAEGFERNYTLQPNPEREDIKNGKSVRKEFGFKPKTGLREGLRKFAEWYGGYYK